MATIGFATRDMSGPITISCLDGKNEDKWPRCGVPEIRDGLPSGVNKHGMGYNGNLLDITFLTNGNVYIYIYRYTYMYIDMAYMTNRM
jgi:hypothetical protein